jgi:myo-inositol 2-dehydrogenase/D-chiro-inositol 1-dehydrogenase
MTATGSTPTASGTAATPATTAPATATPAAATPAAATPAAATAPVAVGLIGAGAIGTFHGETLARRLPGARLAGVADPSPGAAERLAGRLGAGHATTDPAALLADPAVEAVVIAAPARAHADLVQAAARAGKAVFCEKPMAVTLADAARAAAAARAAGVPLQVGFNRRFDRSFRAAHDLVATGGVGTPQLLRSLTRDPGLADPSRVPPWTIFLETLIHDFDALRYLNPGAEAVEVHAVADALVRPDYKDRGLLDTAVVLVRFDNGAIATAEASFQAVYGYDVRGEVFGSGGMVTAGDLRQTSMTFHGAQGVVSQAWQRNVDLFHDAYVAELAEFVACVRTGAAPAATGDDARAALAIALAAVRSVERGRPVRLEEG